jgi:hypothetical protein
LKDLSPEAKVFTDYNWGGYLIWKNPDRRYFVDGRMAGFSWDAPSGESDHAFAEYLSLTCGEAQLKDVFEKYEIDYVLWPVEKEVHNIWSLNLDFASRISNFLFLGKCRPEKVFNKYVEEELGWRKIYWDDVSVIYMR